MVVLKIIYISYSSKIRNEKAGFEKINDFSGFLRGLEASSRDASRPL